MACEQISQPLICQGHKTETTNGFKDNHSVPARSSTDSESTLFNLAVKTVWNKATNIGEVSDDCSDIFPSHKTHKQNSINFDVNKHQQTLQHHNHSNKRSGNASSLNAIMCYCSQKGCSEAAAGPQTAQQSCVTGAARASTARLAAPVSGWKEEQSWKMLKVWGSEI